jgi:hypothetical protein
MLIHTHTASTRSLVCVCVLLFGCESACACGRRKQHTAFTSNTHIASSSERQHAGAAAAEQIDISAASISNRYTPATRSWQPICCRFVSFAKRWGREIRQGMMLCVRVKVAGAVDIRCVISWMVICCRDFPCIHAGGADPVDRWFRKRLNAKMMVNKIRLWGMGKVWSEIGCWLVWYFCLFWFFLT